MLSHTKGIVMSCRSMVLSKGNVNMNIQSYIHAMHLYHVNFIIYYHTIDSVIVTVLRTYSCRVVVKVWNQGIDNLIVTTVESIFRPKPSHVMDQKLQKRRLHLLSITVWTIMFMKILISTIQTLSEILIKDPKINAHVCAPPPYCYQDFFNHLNAANNRTG